VAANGDGIIRRRHGSYGEVTAKLAMAAAGSLAASKKYQESGENWRIEKCSQRRAADSNQSAGSQPGWRLKIEGNIGIWRLASAGKTSAKRRNGKMSR